MTTLREFLQRTRGRLTDAGVTESRLEAELILTDLLRVPRHRLYAFQNDELSAQQVADLEQIVLRRLLREPLAYILGHREFYGIDLTVSPAVMVPRPETELLVERALLVCLERMEIGAPVVVDVGTGAGGIAVNLAMHLPMVTMIATDISAGALEVAKANVQRHNLTGRITMVHGDLLEPVDATVDVIVANLPYIPADRIQQLSPEVRAEPRLALDGGPEGVDLLLRLLDQAKDKAAPNAMLLLEIDPGQSAVLENRVVDLFPGATVSVEQDLAGLDRIFVVELPG